MRGNGIAQIRHRLSQELIKKSKRIFANYLEISFRLLCFVSSLTPKMRKMENLILCAQLVMAAATVGLCIHVIIAQTIKTVKK